MSFKKNKYSIARKVISKDLAQFCFNYLLMSKTVCKLLQDQNQISQFDKNLGCV